MQATRPTPPSPDTGDPTLVQWLALCPLLAAATTLPGGLALALAVPAVVVAGRWLTALAARVLPAPARLPVALLATAAAIGVIALGIRVAGPDLGDAPYLLLPLALACALPLAHGDAVPAPGRVLRDGIRLGGRFALVLAVLASARWTLEPVLPLLGQPAGVLILMGLLLAFVQWFAGRRAPAADASR